MSEPSPRPEMKFEPLLAQMEREEASRRPPEKPRRPRDPRERRHQAIGAALALAGVLLGAGIAHSAQRPDRVIEKAPDPFGGDLSFALLDASFNSLPLDQRLDIIRTLLARLRSMDSNDSALFAAFAAGIAGEARRQLEANVRVLMVDMMDSYAQRYAAATEADREKIIEESMLEMIGLMSEMSGRDSSPEETLERIRRRSERDSARGSRQTGALRVETVEGVFGRVENEFSRANSPAERARITRFMRDTVRYLRGQDVSTGKSKER